MAPRLQVELALDLIAIVVSVGVTIWAAGPMARGLNLRSLFSDNAATEAEPDLTPLASMMAGLVFGLVIVGVLGRTHGVHWVVYGVLGVCLAVVAIPTFRSPPLSTFKAGLVIGALITGVVLAAGPRVLNHAFLGVD